MVQDACEDEYVYQTLEREEKKDKIPSPKYAKKSDRHNGIHEPTIEKKLGKGEWVGDCGFWFSHGKWYDLTDKKTMNNSETCMESL